MKICVFSDIPYEKPISTAKGIVSELSRLGVEVLMSADAKAYFKDGQISFLPYDEVLEECDIVIAVGGDGTVIHHAVKAGIAGKAILGVNAGRLGFLSGLEKSECQLLGQLISGEYEKKSRMLLQAQIISSGRVVYESYCLNDAVVRSNGTRMIDLQVTSHDRKISTYRADGIIFATPTGSTAYSLSAGGPVVDPGLECMIMTPICAHSLINRSIIFSTDNELQVSCGCKEQRRLLVTLDGREPVIAEESSFVNIKKADISVDFITLKKENFYEVLNQKMIDRNV